MGIGTVGVAIAGAIAGVASAHIGDIRIGACRQVLTLASAVAQFAQRVAGRIATDRLIRVVVSGDAETAFALPVVVALSAGRTGGFLCHALAIGRIAIAVAGAGSGFASGLVGPAGAGLVTAADTITGVSAAIVVRVLARRIEGAGPFLTRQVARPAGGGARFITALAIGAVACFTLVTVGAVQRPTGARVISRAGLITPIVAGSPVGIATRVIGRVAFGPAHVGARLAAVRTERPVGLATGIG